jgi:tetrachloro-p-hydroquinone reductive dehalogenase
MRKRKLLRLKQENPAFRDIYDYKIEDLKKWRASIASREENEEASDEIHGALDRVEERLGESEFLAGETYSLADLAWTCVLARLKMLGLFEAFLEPDRMPQIGAYYERLRSRPSFEAAGVWEGRPAPHVRKALLKAMLRGSGEARIGG